MVSYIATGNGNISLVLNNKSWSVSPSHKNYNEIKSGLNTMTERQLLDLVDIPALIVKQASNFGAGNLVEVKNGEVFYSGQPIHNNLSERMLSMLDEGFDISPMIKFMENLMNNPSSRAVNELYGFLEHKGCPITPDGCFLAYKSVSSDFYSKSSGSLTLLQGNTREDGRIYNGVGETIECIRNQVDDDREVECSTGLHVGCLQYSGPGGWYNNNADKVVIVKVNPRDAVSVPKDHNSTKLRVCRYEVVGLYNGAMDKGSVYTENASPAKPEDLQKLTPYQEGYNTYKINKDSLNPYLYDTEDSKYFEWEEGFLDAEDDFYGVCVEIKESCDCGKKPNGQSYHNLRDSSGKFKKKGT